jgi:ribosome-binding factor A
MEWHRHNRLTDLLREEISEIIRLKTKDPRIGFITITHVKLSSDNKFARIFVSVYGSEEEVENTFAGLRSARGFIRSEIATRIRLKNIPEIEFIRDDSIAHSIRIEELLKKIERESESEGKEQQNDTR